jgi:hypothetical protein
MPQRFDASAKYLVETYLADWLALSGRPSHGRTEIIEAELSTVTAAADKVLRVHDQPAWLLNLEAQAHRDPDLVPRLHLYSALLENRHGLRVRSLVVLLRREADHPDLTGEYQRQFDNEPPYLTFRYQVVRLWQWPVEALLNQGLGLVPLAPLSNVTEEALPNVIQAMSERFRREAPAEEVRKLWTATGILMGLRYSKELTRELSMRISGLEDSTFFEVIEEKGAVKAIQKMLLLQGQSRFGAPADAETTARIKAITDLSRLEELSKRLLQVSSWQELLAQPG